MTAIPKKGDLIKCSDPAIREYILFLNANQPDNKKFVIKDLPPLHLFIQSGKTAEINEKINELIDKYTFDPENST